MLLIPSLILPGQTASNILYKATDTHTPSAIDPGRIAAIPLRRFGSVDEVADAAAFLAKNPYASNCILNIDGGLSAT